MRDFQDILRAGDARSHTSATCSAVRTAQVNPNSGICLLAIKGRSAVQAKSVIKMGLRSLRLKIRPVNARTIRRT